MTTMNRPPEGWDESQVNEGRVTFVRHGWRTRTDPPQKPGWEPYFIGVHGADWTRWVYRPIAREGEPQ